MEGLERLQQEFAAARIPTDKPGFYEERQFVRREQQDPAYLDNYARFVQWQPYTSAYFERVEPIVHVVAEELQSALKRDGSPEAHAEAPLVMSRILEREGVWNYVVRGALTITFPPNSGFAPFTFWSVDAGPNGAPIDSAYQWVFAPPFQVIDMTIQSCRYPYPFNHLLPKTIWEQNTEAAAGDPAEILGPGALQAIARDGLSPAEGLDRYLPHYRTNFAPDFPAHVVSRLDTQLKYVPTGVIASDNSLEQFAAFVSQGLTAAQLYAKKMKPRWS
jgi:hypothetical protein